MASAGFRVIAPWLRGYGATAFHDPATPRSGEQAVLGDDLRALLDALRIERAHLVGYDWGGRASCIVSALWPDRVRSLVTIGGYNIQHIATAHEPGQPTQELRLWYQWYFQTERGRAGLHADRRELGRLLWRLWSPNWEFDQPTLDATAASWDSPDFVDVVIHSYRHRHRAAEGDPAVADIERRLAETPLIHVPTIMLQGEADGVDPPSGDPAMLARFTDLRARRVIPLAGHFLPREDPASVVAAVVELAARAP